MRSVDLLCVQPLRSRRRPQPHRSLLSATSALALALASCTSPPPGGEGAELSLYALVTAIDGVQFGPPLGPTIVPTGPFDGTLLPRLRVLVEGVSADGAVVSTASFDAASTPRLYVFPAFENYFVDVPAASYFTDPSLAYRVRVLLDDRELGRSDMSSRVFEVLATVPTLRVGVKVRIESRTAPTLAALAPSTVVAGSVDVPVTITGAGFVHDSVAHLGAEALATTFVSASELVATIPAAHLAAPGTLTLTVVTPEPGGGSASLDLSVVPAVATLLALSPASIPVGSSPQPLTIDGADFAAGALVDIDGVAYTPASVAADRVVVMLGASLLAEHGVHFVSVVNPTAGASNALALELTYPAPVALTLSPDRVAAGATATLLVNGRDFTPDSVILVDGVARATTFNASYQLSTELAGDLASGLHDVEVVTPAPGGGTSATLLLLVEEPAQADFTLLCSNDSFSMPVGQFFLYGCNVMSNRGYSGTVSFSCSNTGDATCSAPGPVFVPENGFPLVFFWVRSTVASTPGLYALHVEATDGTTTETHDASFVLTQQGCGVPSVPELVAPVNGAERLPTVATHGIGARARFDWTAATDAGGYVLTVADNPQFTNQYQVSSTTNYWDGEASYLGIFPGRRYYWRVYAFNSCHSSAWSQVFSFDTAGQRATPSVWCNAVAVTVQAGASTSFTCDASANFGWTGTSTFECGQLPAGASCTASPTSVTITSAGVSIPVTFTLQTSNSTPIGTSFVTPTARAGEISSLSFAQVTVSACSVAAAPTLTGPADAAVNTTFSPTLFWSAIIGATSYTVELATDAAFTNVIRRARPTTASYAVSPGLPPGTTIYWRVAASNNCSTSAFSTARRFTTANMGTFVVSCPQASVSLAQGASTTQTCTFTSRNNFAGTVTPSCTDLGSGLSCTFSPASIALTANASANVDVTVAASASATLGASSGYVRGVSGATSGGTSLAATVSVPCAPVSGAPALVSPADGTTNYFTATPALSWSPVSNATSYTVELASDPGFANLLETATSVIPGYTLTTALPYGTTTYWRVSASNACSASAPSVGWALTPRPASEVSLTCAPFAAMRDTLASTTCTATSQQGYAGEATFTCGNLPAGVACDVSPSTATLVAGGIANVTLTVLASGTAAPGAATVDVTATAGGRARTSAVSVNIQ
ncbi:hypothetical protein L6R52_07940 [Myxococcota bacterium]|nr:hypothetical protein [Myxococcota bacterium]